MPSAVASIVAVAPGADPTGHAVPTPPGWGFHLLLGIPCAWALWASSTPGGGDVLVWFGAVVLVGSAGLVWAVRFLRWAVASLRRGSVSGGGGFVVAPVLVVAVLAALVADVPLRARWQVAEPAFDGLVDGAPAAEPGDAVPFEVPGRVGTYQIDRAVQVGDETWVFVSSGSSGGAFLLAAGFAHLPGGPAMVPEPGGDGYDRVVVEPLGGDWYVWRGYW